MLPYYRKVTASALLFALAIALRTGKTPRVERAQRFFAIGL
jgi:hypothetical protein